MRRTTPSLKEYALSYPQGGRPPKHGKEFRFAKPETWGEPDVATTQVTDRYGTARAMAWDGIHPRLTTRSALTCCSTLIPTAFLVNPWISSQSSGSRGRPPSYPAITPRSDRSTGPEVKEQGEKLRQNR